MLYHILCRIAPDLVRIQGGFGSISARGGVIFALIMLVWQYRLGGRCYICVDNAGLAVYRLGGRCYICVDNAGLAVSARGGAIFALIMLVWQYRLGEVLYLR